jgi:hypothetical protein
MLYGSACAGAHMASTRRGVLGKADNSTAAALPLTAVHMPGWMPQLLVPASDGQLRCAWLESGASQVNMHLPAWWQWPAQTAQIKHQVLVQAEVLASHLFTAPVHCSFVLQVWIICVVKLSFSYP